MTIAGGGIAISPVAASSSGAQTPYALPFPYPKRAQKMRHVFWRPERTAAQQGFAQQARRAQFRRKRSVEDFNFKVSKFNAYYLLGPSDLAITVTKFNAYYLFEKITGQDKKLVKGKTFQAHFDTWPATSSSGLSREDHWRWRRPQRHAKFPGYAPRTVSASVSIGIGLTATALNQIQAQETTSLGAISLTGIVATGDAVTGSSSVGIGLTATASTRIAATSDPSVEISLLATAQSHLTAAAGLSLDPITLTGSTAVGSHATASSSVAITVGGATTSASFPAAGQLLFGGGMPQLQLPVHTSWVGLEVARGGQADTEARISWLGLQVLRSANTGPSETWITWGGVEALRTGVASAQMSWAGVQVLRTRRNATTVTLDITEEPDTVEIAVQVANQVYLNVYERSDYGSFRAFASLESDCRVLTIEPYPRLMLVPHEEHEIEIALELRAVTVPVEHRTIRVEAESRTITIECCDCSC